MLEAQLSIIIGKSLNLHFDKFTTDFEILFSLPVLHSMYNHNVDFQNSLRLNPIRNFFLTFLTLLPSTIDHIGLGLLSGNPPLHTKNSEPSSECSLFFSNIS